MVIIFTESRFQIAFVHLGEPANVNPAKSGEQLNK